MSIGNIFFFLDDIIDISLVIFIIMSIYTNISNYLYIRRENLANNKIEMKIILFWMTLLAFFFAVCVRYGLEFVLTVIIN